MNSKQKYEENREPKTVFTLEVIHDEIVEEVKKEFTERSATGQAKYGFTLDNNNKDDFLQHLKEELMDATLYIAKLQKNERAKR